MLKNRAVVVVVPAYQEEAHIGGVLRTMPGFVDHIVVVDDASVDRTSEVAGTLPDPRVRIIRHARRRGVGAAIATGYAAALQMTTNRRDAVAVMAGDGQMSPDDLDQVVLPIVSGHADYVKGNRFGEPDVRRSMGLPRWIGGQVFSRLTSLAIGMPISDSQCGYTAISRRTLAALELDSLWPSFGYPNDLLGHLGALRARVCEVPVRAIYGTEISKLRLRHLPPIFFLIARAAARRARPSGRTKAGLDDVIRPRETGAEKRELHRDSVVPS